MTPEQYMPLRLQPEYREYVWGGRRLRPQIVPTAEAWVVYAQNRVLDGPFAGQTLADAAAALGEKLLGRQVVQHTGLRFPLLIKLLDCAQWLSLQVHPNDEQAARLEGTGFFGKTEAWHFIAADADAEILCGMKAAVSPQQLGEAIQNGQIVDLAQRLRVQAGDSVLIRPGTIHALGPGLLVYEVQQTSDLTYRVYDWGRPASSARPLHIEKSLAVADLNSAPRIQPLPEQAGFAGLAVSEYFTLSVLSLAAGAAAPFTPDGESFSTFTVTEGQADLAGDGWQLTLMPYESVVIPAACGGFQVGSPAGLRALVSRAL